MQPHRKLQIAFGFSIGLLAVIITLAPGASTIHANTYVALRWEAPSLSNPTVIEVNDSTYIKLDTSRDYILQYPAYKKQQGLQIDGGRNVVIIGGYTTVQNETAALFVRNATGVVHIEGLHIDNPNGRSFDGITFDAPGATIQIQNVRVTDLNGSSSGNHSDVVQAWGAAKELRIDRLTGSSNYQGLFLPGQFPIEKISLSNINLSYSTGGVDQWTYLLWLTGPGVTGCESANVDLANVFVAARPGQTAEANAIWPNTRLPSDCAAKLQGNKVTFSNVSDVTGSVTTGAAPGGDFVPAASIGLAYRQSSESPDCPVIQQGGEISPFFSGPAFDCLNSAAHPAVGDSRATAPTLSGTTGTFAADPARLSTSDQDPNLSGGGAGCPTSKVERTGWVRMNAERDGMLRVRQSSSAPSSILAAIRDVGDGAAPPRCTAGDVSGDPDLFQWVSRGDELWVMTASTDLLESTPRFVELTVFRANDIDCSGNVDSVDALLVARRLAGLRAETTLCVSERQAATALTLQDLLQVRREAAGLSSP